MRSLVYAVAGLGMVATVGCAEPPVAEEERGESESHVEGTEPAGCDVASGQARAKAVLERTTGCAIDAATAGLGEKFDLAGKAFGDTKQLVEAVRSFKSLVKVTNLSSARAALCLKTVGEYAASSTTKDVLTGLAVGLTDLEIEELAKQVGSQFSVGLSETFLAAKAMFESPSTEKIVAFLTQLAGNAVEIGGFVNTCGGALADFGSVSLPNITKYAGFFQTAGTIGSIAKCTSALVFNAADVGKELSCYAADLRRLEQQSKQLQTANDNRCAAFASYVNDPIMKALVAGDGASSEARTDACYAVVHHWGSCLYDAKRDGVFGDKSLTCAECETVCSGYVNDAGDNAYLRPVIDGGFSRAGATRAEMQKLVMDANRCAAQVFADGNQACINFCRGQVADCP